MKKLLLLLPMLLLRPPATYPFQAVHMWVHVYTVMNELGAGACFIFFHNGCDCPGSTDITIPTACQNFGQYADVVQDENYILDGVVCPPAPWVEPHDGPEVLRVCNARFRRISEN